MDSAVPSSNLGQPVDPATVLPSELVAEVFRKLNLAGRLSVSHVCASWRRIALADRCLWTEYRVRGRLHAKAGVLAALLERSNPLPFCLVSELGVPDTIAQLVIDNMARMEKLYLDKFETDHALQRILAQPNIPVLKRFSSVHKLRGDTPIMVSPSWASAPCLERIRLSCRCVWPPDRVFANVHSYSGRVPEGPRLDAPVCQIFPNLSYLSLHHVTPVQLRRLAPLPCSLTTLKLQTADFDIGIDCTPLLRRRPAPILHELNINCTHTAACVIEAMRLFELCAAGPWSLRLRGTLISVQASEPASFRYSIVCLDQSLRARLAEIVPLCCRLSEMDLQLLDLLPFSSAHAVLPALVAVTVNLRDRQEIGTANLLRDTPGIEAPTLQSLTLRTSPHFEKALGGLLDRIVRCFRSPRLATIFVDTDRLDVFDHEEITALLAHAARLEIRTLSREVVYVFAQ